MFTVALFILAQNWKQLKYPLATENIHKSWYTHSLGYCKKKKVKCTNNYYRQQHGQIIRVGCYQKKPGMKRIHSEFKRGKAKSAVLKSREGVVF